MSDTDNRPCKYCGAAWFGEAFPDPDHAPDCPMETGLFPVTEAELADGGILCMICQQPFTAGEHYLLRDLNEACAAIVCLTCGLLERPLAWSA